MVDLDKLDNVIEELENSSKDIMKITSIIKSVEETSKITNDNCIALAELSGRLDLLGEKNIQINQLCKQSAKGLEDYCTESAEQSAKFISTVNTVLLNIKNENNSLYKEFEVEITKRFDRFKSDIIVENRNITIDIQRTTSEKIDNSTGMIKNICDNSLVQTQASINQINKKTSMLTNLCIGSLCISLVLLIVLIVT